MTIKILPSGTLGDQEADNVEITGGSITGIVDLAIEDGGTGASDADTARANLRILGEDESFFYTMAYR